MASNKKEYSLGFIIGAQLKSSFPKAFKAVEKQLAATKKVVKDCGKAWADFGKNAAKLVAGITAAAVGAGTAVWKAVDSIAGAGDRAAKNAAKLKLSTEAYQELEYAFGHAGVEADQFYDAMRTLEGKITEVAFSEESAAQWAEEFGLSAEKLKKMSPEKRIERLADYFNSLEDPIVKDKLAMELFGESGIALTAALSMGSKGIQDLRKEAADTGNVISGEVAKQAEAYEDAKDRMKKTFNGIKTQLFSGLLPVFTSVFGQISERLQGVDWAAWGDKITGWVQDAIPKVQEIAANIGAFVGKIWEGIQTVKDFVGGWENVGKIILGLMSLKTAISGVVAVGKTIAVVGRIIGMLASPVGLVVLAVGALIAIIVLVIKHWEKIKEVAGRVCAAVGAFFAGLGERVKSIAGAIADWWNAKITAIQNWWSSMISAVTGFVDGLKTGVINAATAIADWWNEKITAIQTFFSNLWANVTTGVTEFVAGVIGFFTGLVGGIQEQIDKISGFFSGAWASVKKLATDFVDNILSIFSPITDFFKGIGDWFSNLFGGKKTMTVEVETIGDVPGHAKGGIFRKPHVAQIAEGGYPEAVVPINSNPASRHIWETAGRMAGFNSGDNSGFASTTGTSASRSASDLAGRVVATGGVERYDLSVPVNVTVSGNADANTVNRIKSAAGDIEARVRAAVREQLDSIARQKARLAY